MYILMIARGYPTAKHPQWGCFEKDQAEALAQLGHKVIVASVDSRWLMEIRSIGITTQQHGDIVYLNSFFIPGAVSSLFGHKINLLLRTWQMKRIFKQIMSQYGKPDIIYGQFFFNTILGIELSQRYHIPIVGIEHAARFNENDIDKISLSEALYTYQRTHQIIAVSPNLQLSIKRLFDVDSIFVPNMASKDFTQSTNPIKHALSFVAVGSLEYRKGFDLLPKAFSHLRHLPHDWSLQIIGDGPERYSLQKQIELLGLQSNIILVGQKTKAEILPILQQADAFILPSRNENFSVAVLEALACGIPVISSICGGIKECINAKNGLLFEVDDINGLTQCIQTIIDQPNYFNHQLIAEDYINRFSPPVIAKQLTDIFQATIEQYKLVHNVKE